MNNTYRTLNGYTPTPEELEILKKVYPSSQPSGIAVGSQRRKIERKK